MTCTAGIEYFVITTERVQPGFTAPNIHVLQMNKTEVARRVAEALRAAGLPAKGTTRHACTADAAQTQAGSSTCTAD